MQYIRFLQFLTFNQICVITCSIEIIIEFEILTNVKTFKQLLFSVSINKYREKISSWRNKIIQNIFEPFLQVVFHEINLPINFPRLYLSGVITCLFHLCAISATQPLQFINATLRRTRKFSLKYHISCTQTNSISIFEELRSRCAVVAGKTLEHAIRRENSNPFRFLSICCTRFTTVHNGNEYRANRMKNEWKKKTLRFLFLDYYSGTKFGQTRCKLWARETRTNVVVKIEVSIQELNIVKFFDDKMKFVILSLCNNQ